MHYVRDGLAVLRQTMRRKRRRLRRRKSLHVSPPENKGAVRMALSVEAANEYINRMTIDNEDWNDYDDARFAAAIDSDV